MIRQFYRGNEIWTLPGGKIEENETSEQGNYNWGLILKL